MNVTGNARMRLLYYKYKYDQIILVSCHVILLFHLLCCHGDLTQKSTGALSSLVDLWRHAPPWRPASFRHLTWVPLTWPGDCYFVVYDATERKCSRFLKLGICPPIEGIRPLATWGWGRSRIPTFSPHAIHWLFQYFCHFSPTFSQGSKHTNYIYLYVLFYSS